MIYFLYYFLYLETAFLIVAILTILKSYSDINISYEAIKWSLLFALMFPISVFIELFNYHKRKQKEKRELIRDMLK